VAPWDAALGTLAETRLEFAVDRLPDGAAIRMWSTGLGALPLTLEKRVAVRGATVDARYRLRAAPGREWGGRWVVQWNLALTAGEGPGRYLELPGRPALGSSGRLPAASRLVLVDEWIGVEARLEAHPEAELAWGPVETVSVSESGFERIYQGTAFVLVWPLRLAPGAEEELTTALTVLSR
jgi:alpha-amylase